MSNEQIEAALDAIMSALNYNGIMGWEAWSAAALAGTWY